ncbi:MAG: Rne/Rng family ribonuclease [Oceanicola sp.]|nr:Rne/Rng family ribonuclease [Oceanicola sp.]
MAKKMLIDATHAEETRVVVVDGNKVDEFDFETVNKRQLAGNIYLAKVTRVEPSLQAAFVDYGGNRHGFLAFSEIHPDYYQIPVADREALLEEERAYAEALNREEDEPKPTRRRSRTRGGRSKSSGAKADASKTEDAKPVEALGAMDVVDLGDDAVAPDPELVAVAEADAPHGPVDTVETAETAEEAAPAQVTEADEAPESTDAEPVEAPADAPAEDAEATETADEAATDAEPEEADADGETKTLPATREGDEDAVSTSGEVVDEKGAPLDDATRAEAITEAPPAEEAEDAKGEEAATEEVVQVAEAAPAEDASAEEDAPQQEVSEAASEGDDSAPAEGDDAESDAEPKPSSAADRDADIESVADDDTPDEIRPPRKPRPRRYKIQEVIKVRQVMLVQVVKEERGNKGAALTTYLSLAGRYCVLMPNTARGGGISRKITNAADRKKLKEIAGEIDVPQGAGLIIRTAGAKRTKTEIKRDYEYLQRLWEQIRELTLKSVAPAAIYAEGDLIKRSIRDLYGRDIDEVLVEGDAGYRTAKDFMKMIMPSHAKNVKQYKDQLPMFSRYQVENYLDAMFNPTVQLKSGGYIVIGVTEALVAIDVNSGRATKRGSIEETALETNLEAAEEIARQLRLRDLAGLIVIDFIDMEERKNNSAVEKRFKDKLKNDRARIQVGRISGFGLLEMSRQRLRPGMLEATTQPCPHCHGTGLLRSDDSLGLQILRQIEEEGTRGKSREVLVKVPVGIANFLMNQKREHIAYIEQRFGLAVRIEGHPSLISPDFEIEKFKSASRDIPAPAAPLISIDTSDMPEIDEEDVVDATAEDVSETPETTDEEGAPKKKRRRRRRRRGGSQSEAGETTAAEETAEAEAAATDASEAPAEGDAAEASEEKPKKRRRSRRRRGKGASEGDASASAAEEASATEEAPASEAAAEPEMAEADVKEAEAPEDAAVETVDADPAQEPVAEAAEEAAPVAEAEPAAEDIAEAEVAEAEAAEAPAEDAPAEPEAAPEPEPELESAVAEAAAPAPAKPARPKRSGWWSRG